MGVYRLNNLFMSQVITEQFVKSSPNGLQMMYAKVLEFVPHHCRLLREVTGGTVSRYDVVHHIVLDIARSIFGSLLSPTVTLEEEHITAW